MNGKLTALLSISFALATFASPLLADVRLPKLVGDNMVIQRDARVNIFGTALRVERVTVVFLNRIYAALPDEHGEWIVSLPPLPAGGPYQMEIFGKNTLKIKNILVGDVWLASGQSNMEWTLGSTVTNQKAEIAAANFPNIRFIDVGKAVAAVPTRDFVSAGWQLCTSRTALGFSAAAYFFARQLHQQYNVPVGIVQSSWGGTPAESWISAATLKQFPEFKPSVEKTEKITVDLNELRTEYHRKLEAWQLKSSKTDRGYDTDKPWYEKKLKDKQWLTMPLPGYWEGTRLPGYDGAVWFRREIEVPRAEARTALTLYLARIDDEDITWFNGVKIGETKGHNALRKYTVPANLVKAGRNVIAIRANDTYGNGGFQGEAKDMRVESPFFSASLSGEWKYRTAVDVSQLPKPPAELRDPGSPGVLFNGMIAPIIPYTLKGVIWYQGEANTSRAYQYRNLFPALIRDWRAAWKQKDDFAFVFVQLANFMPALPQPAGSEWAELREAQLFALNEPKTGVAIAIDIGEADDVHPKNKLDVGKRLALAARKVAYQDTAVGECSGPVYKAMSVEANRVRLLFDYVADGLMAKNGTLRQFAIAGADKKFVWANAHIEQNTVVVWSPEVPKPVAVRYAWADNPEGCNLYNTADLPASPFRTDQWPGLTFNVK